MQQKRYHVLIDLAGVLESRLNDKDGLNILLRELPGKINMSVLAGPVIAEGIPENPGISGFVIIDYSHISIHTFTAFGEALVDIFSCKPYVIEDAKKAVGEFFGVKPEQIEAKLVAWG